MLEQLAWNQEILIDGSSSSYTGGTTLMIAGSIARPIPHSKGEKPIHLMMYSCMSTCQKVMLLVPI